MKPGHANRALKSDNSFRSRGFFAATFRERKHSARSRRRDGEYVNACGAKKFEQPEEARWILLCTGASLFLNLRRRETTLRLRPTSVGVRSKELNEIYPR